MRAQSYPHWEWILAVSDGAMHDQPEAVTRLTRESRVRLIALASEESRATAWNAAFRAARGTFAALLDPGDDLSPNALYEIASAMQRAPGCDLFYTDEDCRQRETNNRADPRFKPDWSPELLLSCNYIGRLAFLRVETALARGGFRVGYEGAEEWDLFLRLSRTNARIRRVPVCVYHRGPRADAPGRKEAEAAALLDHCADRGLEAAAVSRASAGYRITWHIKERPMVSIVIPNRNAADVVVPCVRGLLHETSYPRREVVIVDNGSTDVEVFKLYDSLRRDGRGIVIPFEEPFNYSRACNIGAAAARGDLLLFLNNDIEVIHPDWLDELVRWSQVTEVGIVGAKLLYPDRTIQHAGVVFGLGLVSHIFARQPEDTSGPFGSSGWYRNYLAVTGACQAMRRTVFDHLGGFDERFRLIFGDVVLCLKAWKAGFRVVYTPYARLVHHESYTRKSANRPEDMELLVRYLENERFVEDPFFHPELVAKPPIPALRAPFEPTPREVIHDYMRLVRAVAEMAGR